MSEGFEQAKILDLVLESAQKDRAYLSANLRERQHCDAKGKDAMTPERWQRIKALKPRDTQMFVSCAPDKDKHSRATYRKADHGARD